MSELGEHVTTILKREEGLKEVTKGTPFTTFENAEPGRGGVISKTLRYQGAHALVATATPLSEGSNLFKISFELAEDAQIAPTRESKTPPGTESERLGLFAETTDGKFSFSSPTVAETGLKLIKFNLWHKLPALDTKPRILATVRNRQPQPFTVDRSDLTRTKFNFI